MKKVIRTGVFETNSSSSHSLSLSDLTNAQKESGQKIDKGASFEIWSPEAKIGWFRAIVNNAEAVYQNEQYPEFEEKPEDIMQKIKMRAQEILNTNENGEYFLNLINFHSSETDLNLDNYSYAELDTFLFYTDGAVENIAVRYYGIMGTYQSREYVLKFKDMLFDAYCELNSLSPEQAEAKINEAYVKDDLLEHYLSSPATFDYAIKHLQRKYACFSEEYQKAENKEQFVKNFVERQNKLNAKKCDGCYECNRYFGDSPLYTCDCNFETYFLIDDSLTKHFHGDVWPYMQGPPYDEDNAMDFLTNGAVIAHGGDLPYNKENIIY